MYANKIILEINQPFHFVWNGLQRFIQEYKFLFVRETSKGGYRIIETVQGSKTKFKAYLQPELLVKRVYFGAQPSLKGLGGVFSPYSLLSDLGPEYWIIPLERPGHNIR